MLSCKFYYVSCLLVITSNRTIESLRVILDNFNSIMQLVHYLNYFYYLLKLYKQYNKIQILKYGSKKNNK